MEKNYFSLFSLFFSIFLYIWKVHNKLIKGAFMKNKNIISVLIVIFLLSVSLTPIKTETAEEYSQKGYSYLDEEEFTKAIEEFTKAIELDYYYHDAYVGRGIAYIQKKDYDKAIEDFNTLIDKIINYMHYRPDKQIYLANVYFYRAIAYNHKGNDRALGDYTSAIFYNPYFAEAYYYRGYYFYNKKEYEHAKEDFQKAKELGITLDIPEFSNSSTTPNANTPPPQTTPTQTTTVKQDDTKDSGGEYILNTSLISTQYGKAVNKSWWINPATGKPNVIIVMGASLSDADKRSAYTLAQAIINTSGNSKINTDDILILDILIDEYSGQEPKNIILIGGPTDNSFVKGLVDKGKSTVDWSKSTGDWEYISDPGGIGIDILIIGKSREETLLATNEIFTVRSVLPVPISKTAPTQAHYYKRTMEIEDTFYTLPDYDQDGVPDKYDEHPYGGGGRSYSWFSWKDDKEILRTWELEAPSDTVEFYDKIRPKYKNREQFYTSFVFPNDKVITALVVAFENSSKDYTEDEKVSLVLKFTQFIKYTLDDETITRDEKDIDYPRYPTQTLFDRAGDCEDSSILFASLMKHMDKDVLLFTYPGHMVPWVSLSYVKPKQYPVEYLTYDGKKYYYCETTNIFGIGQLPIKMIGVKYDDYFTIDWE